MHLLNVTRENKSDTRYGIRKSLIPVVDSLKEKGHRVEIFDQQKAANIKMNQLEIWLKKICLNGMKKKFGNAGIMAGHIISERVSVGWKAAKYAAKNNISHVHCHDPLLAYFYQLSSKIYRSTKCFGYKITAFGQFVKPRLGIRIDKKALQFLQNLEEKAERKAKWVILTTNSGMKQMQKDLKKETIPEHWHLVPNPVTVELYDRNLVRKKLGIAKDEKLLVAVGQLIPLKRFDLLLHSVSLVPSSHRPRIILLGDGPEEQNLNSLSVKLKIENNFEIKTTDNIGEYLSAADIYVSVSSTESFGLANCEAVLAGVPSICTNVGAVSELLGDAVILINDDKHIIAQQIRNLLASKELRSKLKKRSKSITAKWLDSDTIAKKMEDIFVSCKAN